MDEKKFKVTVEMKNGNTWTAKVTATPEKISEVFLMLDRAWKERDIDGVIQVGSQYFRMTEIASYKIKQVWF